MDDTNNKHLEPEKYFQNLNTVVSQNNKEESVKDYIASGIVAIAVIVASLCIMTGMGNIGKSVVPDAYSLYGYEGVLYRLNNVNGRIDVMVPSDEGALLFPASQVQFPQVGARMKAEEKANLSRNMKLVAKYVQKERARSLGIEK